MKSKYKICDFNNYDDVILKLNNLKPRLLKTYICSILWWNKNKMEIVDGNVKQISAKVIERYGNKLKLSNCCIYSN